MHTSFHETSAAPISPTGTVHQEAESHFICSYVAVRHVARNGVPFTRVHEHTLDSLLACERLLLSPLSLSPSLPSVLLSCTSYFCPMHCPYPLSLRCYCLPLRLYIPTGQFTPTRLIQHLASCLSHLLPCPMCSFSSCIRSGCA